MQTRTKPRAGRANPAPRAAWRREAARCSALFLAAAAARLLFLRGTVDRDLPFSIFYYGDSRLYREFALSVIRGEVFDQGIPYHPPLLAWLLAAVIRLVGENPGALRGVLAVLSASAVPLAYMLGMRLWDRRVALVGALMSVFSFGLLVAGVSPNTESIYVAILTGQVLALVMLGDALAAGERGRALRLSVVSGALLGLGSLTRAEHLGLALAVPAALTVGWPGIGLRRTAKASLGAFVVAAAVIAPWTLHNYLALGRFNRANPGLTEPLPRLVLISNYGALNFALANNAGSDGTFKPNLIVGSSGGQRLDLLNPRHLAPYLHGYRDGLAFLASAPKAGALLLVRKAAISSEAATLGFGLSDWPAGLEGKRRAVDFFAPSSKVLMPFSLALLAAGAFISRAGWRRASPVWLVAGHKMAICLAFFGYVRLFVPLAPLAHLVQASALVSLVTRLPWVWARRAAATLGIAAALLLGAELLLRASEPMNFRASGSTDPVNGKIIQDAEVALAPVP